MRSFFPIIYLFVYFTVALTVMLILLLIGLFNMNLRDKLSLLYVQLGLGGIFFFSGSNLNVVGLSNIPKDEAVMFVGNHISYFDVIATYILWSRPTGYISKKEIKKIPILNWLMYFVHCLFLDRNDPREGLKMVIKAAEMIQNGISIVIFPEGTRSKDGKLLEFKEGSFKIAAKAKCKIIPMGITGTPDIFETHMPWLKPQTVTIRFGKPIDTKDMDRQELKKLPSIVRSEVAKLSGQEIAESK